MPQRKGIISVAWKLVIVAFIALTPKALQAQYNIVVPYAKIELKVPGERPVDLYENSYALVIGASAYTNGWSKLGGVPGDVRAVRAALTEVGFNVIELKDPKLLDLESTIKNFIGEFGQNPQNRLLIYFAGHGHTVKSAAGSDLGYIIPVDAPLPNERNIGPFKVAAMSMEWIESISKQIDAKHALFVFDSCFSGTFFKMRASPETISLKTTLPVRQFITAGSADQLVPDESVFRQQFVAGIRGEADLNQDGYVTGSELGMFLEDKVTNYSRQTQTPQYGKIRDPNLDKGDFVFQLVRARTSSISGRTATTIDPMAFELSFWESVRDSRDAEELKAYVDQFPNGKFVGLAKMRVSALSRALAFNAPLATELSKPAPAAVSAANPKDAKVAGSTSQRQKPVHVPSGADPGFEIEGFQINGNRLVSTERITSQLQRFTGKNKDFIDVQRALELVENIYATAGFAAVQIILPEQELDTGRVRINVIEAKIGKILIEGNRIVSDIDILASLPSLKIGIPPNIHDLEKNLRLANNTRGRQIALSFKGSEILGEVVAVVKVSEGE